VKIGFEYIVGVVVFLFSFLAIYGLLQPYPFVFFAAAPKTEQTTAELTISRYINTGINNTPVNFTYTGIVPGYWYNASNGTGLGGWPLQIIVFWETNTNVNTSYWGSQYFCMQGSTCDQELVNRFQIGNLTYNTSSTNFTSAGDQFHHYATGLADVHIVNGNQTPALEANLVWIYNATCPCGEENYTLPVYYRLFVPQGAYSGNWQANLTFRVVDAGGGGT